MKKMTLLALCLAIVLSAGAGCKPKPAPGPSSGVSGGGSASGASDQSGIDSLPSDASEDASSSGGISGSSRSTSGSASGTAAPDKPVTVKDPFSVNLGGATLTIATSANYSFLIDADPNKSSYYKAINERLKKLEKELNCKVKLKKSTDTNALTTQVTNALLAGEQYADIVITAIHQMTAFASKGLLANLNAIQGLDLKQPYMDAGKLVTNGKVADKAFMVSPQDSLLEAAVGVYFNTRILEELKLESPYSLMSKNQWTIAKLRELALAARQQNVTATSGRYGMTVAGFSWESTEPILANNRTPLITNVNGNPAYAADSPGVLASIAQARQMYLTDNGAYINHSDDETAKMFMDGRALFLVGYVTYADDIANMNDDFGFVPFPRGNDKSGYLSAVNYNSRCLMIPSNLSQARKRAAGSFIQAFMYQSQTTTKALINGYDARYYRDDQSVKNLQICADNLTINPHAVFVDGGGNLDNGTLRVIFQGVDGRKEPAEILAQFKNGSQALLADMVSKMKAAK